MNGFGELTRYVRFGHENLLEFLVARQLLAAAGTLTPALLHAVVADYAAAGRRVELLKWLLLFGLQRQNYAAVAEVFDLALEEYELHALSHFLGLELRGAPAAAAALLPLLAARPAAQTYFFERFVDLSNLNDGYGVAIGHYLRHKPTPEAQLFGHCLLFTAALLRQDEAACRSRAAVRAVPLAPGIHPFPLGRRMAAQLLYGHSCAWPNYCPNTAGSKTTTKPCTGWPSCPLPTQPTRKRCTRPSKPSPTSTGCRYWRNWPPGKCPWRWRSRERSTQRRRAPVKQPWLAACTSPLHQPPPEGIVAAVANQVINSGCQPF